MMEELLYLLYICAAAALIGFSAGCLFGFIAGIVEYALLRRK